MLKGLSMERKQKWGLFALFSFGILLVATPCNPIHLRVYAYGNSTCVAGVLKVVFLIKQNIYAITEEGKSD